MTSTSRTLYFSNQQGNVASPFLWSDANGNPLAAAPGPNDFAVLNEGFVASGALNVLGVTFDGYGNYGTVTKARISAVTARFQDIDRVFNSSLTFRADPARLAQPAVMITSAWATLTASTLSAYSGSPTLAALSIGDDGAGALTLDQGSSLQVTGGFDLGAYDYGFSTLGTGTLLVTNGSTATLANPGGIALRAGKDAWSNATLTVTGAGSVLAVTDGFTLGGNGSATLTASGGGLVTAQTLADNDRAIVDGGTLVARTLTGSGALIIQNNGQVQAGDVSVSAGYIDSGTLTVTGALTVTGLLALAGPAAHLSYGSLAIAPNGLLDLSHAPPLDIASLSTQGTIFCTGGTVAGSLDIGGLVVTGGVLTVGAGAGAPLRATHRISGTGTIVAPGGLILDNAEAGGTIFAGSAGTPVGLTLLGTASIRGGAPIDITGTALLGGQGLLADVTIHGGSGGALLVVGAAAGETAAYTTGGTVTIAGDALVGQNGVGSLTVAGAFHAGIVSVGDGAAGFLSLGGPLSAGTEDVAALLIGRDAGTGTVTVGIAGGGPGTPQSVLVRNGLAIGLGSTGLLSIQNGSMQVSLAPGVALPALTVGVGTGVSGSLSISTGTLAVNGDAVLGYQGSAHAAVTFGGTLSATAIDIGALGTGSGALTMSGAGALVTAGSLIVGGTQASGSLSVGLHATVRISGDTTLHGAASLSGGTLTGTGTLTIDRGFALTGYGSISEGAIVVQGHIVANAKRLACLGPITGLGTLAVQGGAEFAFGGEARSLRNSFGAGGGTFTTLRTDLLPGMFLQWDKGDFVHLAAQGFTEKTVVGHTLVLRGNSVSGTLTFAGTHSAADFVLTPDGKGGTVISHG